MFSRFSNGSVPSKPFGSASPRRAPPAFQPQFEDETVDSSEAVARVAPLPARRRGRQRLMGKEARGMHAALAQEAYDTSMLVAVTGSIVNAIVAGKRPTLRNSITCYQPPQPTLFPSAVSAGTAASAVSAQAMQNMIAFYGLISFARAAAQGFSAKRDPAAGAGPIGGDTLGEAWQAAAMQSVGVLASLGFLDKNSSLYEHGRDNSKSLRLVEMLWAVTLGRTPCVRIDGAIIVPGWVERRTHLRREINAPATLLVNGLEQPVTVRDLSAGGLGIEGDADVHPGDRVSVSLGSGVNFDGVAVWNRHGRIGVKLTTGLTGPIDDQ